MKTLAWIRGLSQIFEIFEVPVPHDNKTGDAEFMKNYIFKNDFWKQVNTNSHQILGLTECLGRAIIYD